VYVFYHVGSKKGYVGQSWNVGQRHTVILNQLAAGVHHNLELQADYDRHGEQAFAFKVLRRVSDGKQARLDAEYEVILTARRANKQMYNKNLDRDNGEDWS
jgi:hypothetical protein